MIPPSSTQRPRNILYILPLSIREYEKQKLPNIGITVLPFSNIGNRAAGQACLEQIIVAGKFVNYLILESAPAIEVRDAYMQATIAELICIFRKYFKHFRPLTK